MSLSHSKIEMIFLKAQVRYNSGFLIDRAIDLVVTGIFSCLRSKDKTTIVPLILVEMYKGLSGCACGITNIPFFMGHHANVAGLATREHLEKALPQAAIECGEEEAFFSQHLVPKGDIPRTVLLKPRVISFSAHDVLLQGAER
ncbi:unnamed protein product [Dovyalis caffra]|uniref:Uncharacterized protein n=1 Tax=Dovyalis caffra TaxID=77055 RepID=A0AAV1RR06_9ROSI|nr:unnamed protein product [Dovyalis caffra]